MKKKSKFPKKIQQNEVTQFSNLLSIALQFYNFIIFIMSYIEYIPHLYLRQTILPIK